MPAEKSPPQQRMRALIDFLCLEEDCRTPIQFNLMGLTESKGHLSCTECHRGYQFDPAFLDKLQRFRNLILAVRDAEDLLGDVNVGVTTPGGEEKIPYRLLLTRLNTTISLDVGGRKVDFLFRVEPLNDGKFK